MRKPRNKKQAARKATVLKPERESAFDACLQLPAEAQARLEGFAAGMLMAYKKQQADKTQESA